MSYTAQATAVAGKLKERNPNFDGEMIPELKDGVVIGLQFNSDNVTDISPVRAFSGLRTLKCGGTLKVGSKLADLSPLRGMKLIHLNCGVTCVFDLAPLRGMELTELRCYRTRVSDLSPLEGMPLTELNTCFTQVSDLAPLKGMPLTTLNIVFTQVSSLSPLKNMKLTSLRCMATPVSDLSPLMGMQLVDLTCNGSKVHDLSPLRGMPLTTLDIFNTSVSDLSPLRDMPLTDLHVLPVSDLSPLKAIKTLRRINNTTPKEFWESVAHLDPKSKPSTKTNSDLKTGWDTPAKGEDAWFKQFTGMSYMGAT